MKQEPRSPAEEVSDSSSYTEKPKPGKSELTMLNEIIRRGWNQTRCCSVARQVSVVG